MRCDRAQSRSGSDGQSSRHSPAEDDGRRGGGAGGAGLPSHHHALTAPPDAPQATTGGTGWAQIPLNKESTATAPTEAHTAPQTVGGCHSPPTARNAPHRARRSPTERAAWHGGIASADTPKKHRRSHSRTGCRCPTRSPPRLTADTAEVVHLALKTDRVSPRNPASIGETADCESRA